MAEHHSNPALFPHGLTPGARLVIYLLASILLLTLDARYHGLFWLRAAANSLIYPLQAIEQIPVSAFGNMSAFFVKQGTLLTENRQLRRQAVRWQLESQQLRSLSAENHHLRALLDLRSKSGLTSHAAEIVGISRNPYQALISLDRGSLSGIQPGSAVIDETGLVGQITSTYPLTSTVTLITDKDQSVPVRVQRTGQNAIMFGTGQGVELRYLPHSTDIRPGDLLVTSGLGGVFPAGLDVARITSIDNRSARAFDIVSCQPLAAIDREQQVLIVDTHPQPR